MIVDLSFDYILDLEFLFTGRFPMALKEEIGKHKNEIYKSLSESLLRPDELTGAREFQVEGRSFHVEFVSRQSGASSPDIRKLRVIAIEERQ